MGLRAATQRLRQRLAGNAGAPSAIVPGWAPGIYDGVPYGQPAMLPEHLKNELQRTNQMKKYLQEAARETYRFQFDTPGRGPDDMIILQVTEDPLREWSPGTRRYVLSNTHAAGTRNPLAKLALRLMSSFTIGSGFNLTCKNKQVQEILEAFIDSPDNCVREYERNVVKDLGMDGELFIRFFVGKEEENSAGQLVMAPLRPWEIAWIHTEKGFFKRPLSYHFQPYTTYNTDDPDNGGAADIEDIPADQLLHVAINKSTYELRGRPELYAALPWLKAYKDWLENRARQNHWRGAMLWWVKIAAQAQVIAQKIAQYARPPTSGSIAVTTDKEQWNVLSNPVGAADASDDGRQIKLMATAGMWGIPEYMVGDGENANLATSKSQQLPILTTFGEMQTILVEQLWIPLFKRVLQLNIDAGLLPEEVDECDSDGEPIYDESEDETREAEESPDARAATAGAVATGLLPPNAKLPSEKPKQVKKIKTLDAFEVEYEPVSDEEPKTLAEALDIAVRNGWASDQTASNRMGFDWTIEQKRIKAKEKADREAIARGEKMPPPQFTPQGFGSDDDAARNEANDAAPTRPD